MMVVLKDRRVNRQIDSVADKQYNYETVSKTGSKTN